MVEPKVNIFHIGNVDYMEILQSDEESDAPDDLSMVTYDELDRVDNQEKHGAKKLPFPFPEPPSVQKYYPKPIAMEPVALSPIVRKSHKKSKKLVQAEEEADRFFSPEQIEGVMAFIKSCCHHDDEQEITLSELEAAFRKHKLALYSEDEEEHARGLLESLGYLLQEAQLTTEAWFKLSDVKGALGGDGKLTYAELHASLDNLCDRLNLPRWSEHDIFHMLKFMDPSGDGDLTDAEVKLAFKRHRDPARAKEIITKAGPLMSKLEAYMHKKHIRVIDLFRSIDIDNSNTISMKEIRIALIRFFCDKNVAERLLSCDDESCVVSVTSMNSGWAKYNGMTIHQKKPIPLKVIRAPKRFPKYVKNVEHDHPDDISNLTESFAGSSFGTRRRRNSFETIESHEDDDLSLGSGVYSKASKSTMNTRKKKHFRLEPMELSSNSLQRMQSILLKSQENFDDAKTVETISLSSLGLTKSSKGTSVQSNESPESKSKPRKKYESKYPLRPVGLQGSAVDIRATTFQDLLYKEALGYEKMLVHYGKSLRSWKHKLSSL